MEAAHGLCRIAWVVDRSLDGGGLATRLLARFGEVVDVTDMSIDMAAKAVSEQRPDGIVTFKDSRLRFTAELAQRLGLPFHSPTVAERLTDKFTQRMALRDGGVAVPGFDVVPATGSRAGWAELAARASFPAVLKPRRDNEASRDTVLVESLSELRRAAAKGNGAEMVLEEYLADRVAARRACFADYVSVESVVSDGCIGHLAINGRFPPAEPFRESGFFIEAELDQGERRAALETATAALTALEIENGCCHTEIKFTPAGARVIEVNGRIGGGVPEMLSDISDVALLQIAMRIALGHAIDARGLMVAPDRVGFLFYVHAPKSMRRVAAVEGIERLRADPHVTDVILNRGPGQSVDWREGNQGHVFSVRGTVADHDELEVMHERVRTEVRIEGD
jgi:biotin carboxylase